MGGGHAHVQVLRSWAMDPPPNVRLQIVLDRPTAIYSGMVPGFVAGDYALSELEIDVVPLARRARAGVILSRALDIDPVSREITLEGRPPLRFDVASLDVGSTVRGLDLPGVREHALATRPIGDFVLALDRRVETLRNLPHPARVAIVGAGAAGTELAFTMRARFSEAGIDPEITLLTEAATALTGSSRRACALVQRELDRAGIQVATGRRVVRVEADALIHAAYDPPKRTESPGPPTPESDRPSLEHEPGESLPADLVVWATGAAPIAFPAGTSKSALPRDRDGFLSVTDTLQAVGFERVFGAGDCVRQTNHPWVPRAGVYAVRQGPYLDYNLRALLDGKPLHRYTPQRDFLSLLHLGDRRALGMKWGWAVAHRAIARLKHRIDVRFMERFQILDADGLPHAALAELGRMRDESGELEEMACGGCAAKLAPAPLESALDRLPAPRSDDSVLLGLESRDDVAATRDEGGGTTLHNVDVIRAFCDDPWLVGRVAASNALSDLFASGGVPRHAQAIIAIPDPEHEPNADSARILAPGALPGSPAGEETLFQALAGLGSVLDQHGVSLLGGHTTLGDTLSVGLSVTGSGPSADDLLRRAGARAGDLLFLTQPIGTGVVLAADMQGLARGAWVEAVHRAMQHDNDRAGQLALDCGAQAMTDVTGFGLAGHLLSMLEGDGLMARIDRAALPLLPGAATCWRQGLLSTAHPANHAAFASRVEARDPLDEAWLFDPQTAGGLLIAIDPARGESLVRSFAEAGEPLLARIGTIHPGTDPQQRSGAITLHGEFPAPASRVTMAAPSRAPSPL